MENHPPTRIIPDHVRADVTVHLDLPAEARALMTDLHSDRASIGAGGVILLACVVALTIKRLFRKG